MIRKLKNKKQKRWVLFGGDIGQWVNLDALFQMIKKKLYLSTANPWYYLEVTTVSVYGTNLNLDYEWLLNRSVL
jgi:hypothetical protein